MLKLVKTSAQINFFALRLLQKKKKNQTEKKNKTGAGLSVCKAGLALLAGCNWSSFANHKKERRGK